LRAFARSRTSTTSPLPAQVGETLPGKAGLRPLADRRPVGESCSRRRPTRRRWISAELDRARGCARCGKKAALAQEPPGRRPYRWPAPALIERWGPHPGRAIRGVAIASVRPPRAVDRERGRARPGRIGPDRSLGRSAAKYHETHVEDCPVAGRRPAMDCASRPLRRRLQRSPRPGPELGPEGYRRLGARFGLEARPRLATPRWHVNRRSRGIQAPSRARARRGDLGWPSPSGSSAAMGGDRRLGVRLRRSRMTARLGARRGISSSSRTRCLCSASCVLRA